MKNTSNTLKIIAFCAIAVLICWGIYHGVTRHDADFGDTEKPVQVVSWAMKNANTMSHLEAKLRKSPNNIESQIALAQTYLTEAQQSLQEAYYLPRAQKLVDQVLEKDPEHFAGLAIQASLFNTLHQFEKARDIAKGLIKQSPGKAYVYGILIDALVELGEYEEAVEVCDRMLAIRPGLASFSRASYLRELHGDGEGARQAMEMAAEAGVAGSADRSWALYQLGQLYLGEDNLEAARQLFEGILDETPYYAYALGGLGQVAMQQQKWDMALTHFEQAYSFVPADEFLEGIIEVYTLKGEGDKVPHLVDKITESFTSADAMGENVNMEFADFLIDQERDLDKALVWAKMEYERRPNHLHALETYAWALHQSGESAEAIPYIEKAMRLDTGDAMVQYRAGHIYLGAGQQMNAVAYFKEAISNNLHIESPTAAAEVKTLL